MTMRIRIGHPSHPLQVFIFVVSLFISTSWAGSFDDYLSSLRNDQISPILGLQLRNFDLNTKDEKGTPPLVVALSNDSYKVADYLIQQPGMDLDATNAKDENALMLAALKGQLGIARALLARGAQANKPGWAPLHYAATSAAPESEQMAKLLLDHYAYIDAASPNQTTPLMMAARYGSNKVVQLLLDEGADPTLTNDKGMTALDFAHSVSRKDIAQLISLRMARSAPVSVPTTKDVDAGGIDAEASHPETTPFTETMPVAVPAVLGTPLGEGAQTMAEAEAVVEPDAQPALPEARIETVAEPVQVPTVAPDANVQPAVVPVPDALPSGW